MGHSKWQKIAVEGQRTRVLFSPITGRTHQLRVHAAHPLGLGHPIVGDPLYGSGQKGERMLLHSSFLSFRDPTTGKTMIFEATANF